jgi:hypothetical protein
MIEKVRKLLEPDVSLSAKLVGISLFFGKLFEKTEVRIEKLEERQLQKGDKGEQGQQGERGAKGDKGDVGPQGIAGQAGKDGNDGKDGKSGKQGVSVVDAEIAADDHLVFKLSNGKEIDAGELPKASSDAVVSVSGNAWQITVSDTPPANPQINDLWFDIR